ncbi:MAG: hypothetical protein RLZZ58_910 [Pseudomonadota bacterium]
MKLPPGPLINALAILNVAIFALLTLTGLNVGAILAAGFIPARFAMDGGLIAAPGTMLPAWLTPVTSAFLHGDVLHLASNMIMLMFIGRQLEAPMGRVLLSILMLSGALAGCFAEWAADPASLAPVIGASGAISALFGCYALIFSTQKARAIGPIPAAVVRAAWLGAAWIVFQLLLGLASGGMIAIWAHIGGFLAGLLLARPLLRRRFRT